MLVKAKEAYACWLRTIVPNIPKSSRPLGRRIDGVFLEVIETMFHAAYASIEEKKKLLGTGIAKLDTLKFLLQIAWEDKVIPTQKYAALSDKLQEVGRMLGGWKNQLLKQTSAYRERK